MAHVRKRKLRTGTFWYVVEADDREHACGPGKRGERRARSWAERLNLQRYDQAAGFEESLGCLWTFEDLARADLADARRRGLRTALPQTGGKRGTSKRASHWRQLISFFGADIPLDTITQTRLREYVDARLKLAGPTAVNRDLWGVLRPALRLARDTEASGYRGDPFRGLRKLDERAGRREPIALSAREAEKFVRICWQVNQELGAHVELMYLTGSRVSQEPEASGRILRYPAHKGGFPRVFALDARLRGLVAAPRRFDRALWGLACRRFGRPSLRPHDLRHTRLTLEGRRPGASLLDVQRLGGWRSPAMASVYLHPGRDAIRVLPRTRRERARG